MIFEPQIIKKGIGSSEDVCKITLVSSDPEGGIVTGGGVASPGIFITVNAEVSPGYNFMGWQEDGETVSEEGTYSFVVSGNRNLVAVFEERNSALPDGYTEVEYIYYATIYNYYYIPTNYQLTSSDIVSITYQRLSATDYRPFFGYLLSAPSSYDRAELYIASSSDTSYSGCPIFMDSFNVYKRFTTKVNQNKSTYIIDYPNKKISVAEINKNVSFTKLPNSYSKVNFFNSYSSNAVSAGGRLYGCTITDAQENVKARFIPCISPNGVVGLFDAISREFYSGDVDSKAVAAGPAI